MNKTLTTCFVVAALVATGSVAWASGLDTTTTDLPPAGVYIDATGFHEYLALGIKLDDPSHQPILDRADTQDDGDDEREFFDSLFWATNIGTNFPGLITLSGPVEILTREKAIRDTGTFQTEMISMDLTGTAGVTGPPIIVRQDPNRPSLGVTTITDLGGGQFHVDSFFDVFTEISVDNGANWIASEGSTHMSLVPEPGSLTLVSLGLLGVLAFARRRRRR